jgi:hypothetical protein
MYRRLKRPENRKHWADVIFMAQETDGGSEQMVRYETAGSRDANQDYINSNENRATLVHATALFIYQV